MMKRRKTLIETEDDSVEVGKAKMTAVLCVMGSDGDASNCSTGTNDAGFVTVLSINMTPR